MGLRRVLRGLLLLILFALAVVSIFWLGAMLGGWAQGPTGPVVEL